MSILMGYRIPGSNRGQAFTLPDDCFGLVGEGDADNIADNARRTEGIEPPWQRIRGALIRLARARRCCNRQGAKS